MQKSPVDEIHAEAFIYQAGIREHMPPERAGAPGCSLYLVSISRLITWGGGVASYDINGLFPDTVNKTCLDGNIFILPALIKYYLKQAGHE